MGLAQGVEVLVGQRQGEERPDIAARTAHRGVIVGTLYMVVIATLYCTIPHVMVSPFALEAGDADWAAVSALIPVLLQFVAAYSLADAANMVYAFALRGAGDTRFVSLLAIGLSWPIMVIPTWLAWKYQWGLQAAWGFATTYVVSLAFAFWLRFRGGKWRTMKVIEPHVEAVL
jgi:multidrug resistance protein, MATE family